MDQPHPSFTPNILVAPLDWGLGHATRCVPVIRELLAQKAVVLIAGSGAVQELLSGEFPQLPVVDLQGYDVSYSRNKWALPFVMASQIPKILSAIQYENERLQEIVEKHDIHGIISDNRYGLYHETLPSVFMTHQLLIKTGLGKKADEYLQSLNFHHINYFTECWVPDAENEPNLAGELSHPPKMPGIPSKYLGPLSRFSAGDQSEEHILFLLSGPEPQRTILEEMILDQLPLVNQPMILVRGLPGSKDIPQLPAHVVCHNHLPSGELQRLASAASFIISRCGYSTVMDLAALKKKSILIPTPGQTEQEYLARHLMKHHFAFTIEQQKFKLRPALDLAAHFNYRLDAFTKEDSLAKAVRSFLNSCGPAGQKR